MGDSHRLRGLRARSAPPRRPAAAPGIPHAADGRVHPPLSPVSDVVDAAGYDPGRPDAVFATIDSLRIPVEYLANLFTADDSAPTRRVLRKLAAVRAIQRAGQLGQDLDEQLPASVGASAEELDDLFRLLAIAKYEGRYVIPPAHAEEAGRLMGDLLAASFATELMERSLSH